MLERDLRLGFRALGEGLVRQDQLREAMAECLLDDTPSLKAALVRRGAPRPRLDELEQDLDRSRAEDWPATNPPSTHGSGDSDRSFVDATASTAPSPASEDRPWAPPAGVPPQAVGPLVGGRYELIRVIGVGGLGRVWLARDLHLGREVALKELRVDRPRHADLIARLGEEARITSHLEHPGIVPLYDLVERGGEGLPTFYTMRYLAGRTLGDASETYHRRKREGTAAPLEFRGLLDAFIAVCRAVAYAHSKNVLHRDLKGSNVVLGDFGEASVIDWGLAKSAKGEALASSTFGLGPADRDETEPGSVLGTPGYLAPELILGEAASIHSDVYSLGAILYLILTGRPSYAGESRREILMAARARDPEPPREVAPDAPEALEAACLKAMSRDPRARYGSASELAGEIRRWLADEPVEAYPDPPARLVARWARKHRQPVLVAVASLVLAVVGLATSTAMIWREQAATLGQMNEATRARVRAEKNVTLASYLAGKLLVIAEAQLSPIPGSEGARAEFYDQSLELFRASLQQQPDDPTLRRSTARLSRSSALIHRLMNESKIAENNLRVSIALHESLALEAPYDLSLGANLVLVLVDHAHAIEGKGRLREAAGVAGRALGLAEELALRFQGRPEAVRALGASLNGLASIEDQMNHPSESAGLVERSLGLLEGLQDTPALKAPSDPFLLAAALRGLAMARLELGRGAEGRGLLDRGVVLMGSLLEKNPENNNASQYLAQFLVDRARATAGLEGRRGAAERDLDEAIRIWDRLADRFRRFPFYKESAAEARRVRGALRAASGAFELADDDLEGARRELNALAVQFEEFPCYRANLGRTYLEQGRLAIRLGQFDRARDRLDRAVKELSQVVESAPEPGRERIALEEAKAERSRPIGPPPRASTGPTARDQGSGIVVRGRHDATVRGQVAAGDGDGDFHAIGQRD